ncbi:MAG: NAD(P)/FAD-dependent oxidoreductase [bacterium]
MWELTIIGGGPTGLFAAFYAGMRALKTKIIEALPYLGGQCAVLYPEKFIYDVAGFPKIQAKVLVNQLIKQAMQFQPTVVLEETVEELKVEGERRIVLKTQKGVHETQSVLIATGIGSFQPQRLQVPGVAELEGRGVAYFVRNIHEYEGKRILIIGGGDSAVDWALHLAPYAKKVTLIHRRDKFRAHEDSVKKLFMLPVDVKLFYELKEVRGNDEVEEVVIYHNKTGEEIVMPVDAVLINIGFKADLERIKGWGVELDGKYIRVNGRMETNLPGVYAAGDVCNDPNSVHLNLLAVGFAQAAIAVNCIANYLYPERAIFPGHSSEGKWAVPGSPAGW